MKVYLYMCDKCGNAKFSCVKQNVWYTDCGGCREMTFHNNIEVYGVRDLYFHIGCLSDKKEG